MKKILILIMIGLSFNGRADTDVVENSPLCKSIEKVVGISPKNATKQLGTPTNKSEKAVKNPYVENAKDKEIILNYPGGYTAFRYLSYNNKYILISAKLNTKSFNALLKATVPSDLKKVILKHGKPDKDINGAIRYYCTFEANEWVNVYHKNGKVTDVEFIGYLD